MGHNNVVSGHPKSTGIPRVDGLSTRSQEIGSSQNVTQKAISKDIKPDLWPKVSLKNEVLIISKPYLLYPKRIHLESLWL